MSERLNSRGGGGGGGGYSHIDMVYACACLLEYFFANLKFVVAIDGFQHCKRSSGYMNWVYFEQIIVGKIGVLFY